MSNFSKKKGLNYYFPVNHHEWKCLICEMPLCSAPALPPSRPVSWMLRDTKKKKDTIQYNRWSRAPNCLDSFHLQTHKKWQASSSPHSPALSWDQSNSFSTVPPLCPNINHFIASWLVLQFFTRQRTPSIIFFGSFWEEEKTQYNWDWWASSFELQGFQWIWGSKFFVWAHLWLAQQNVRCEHAGYDSAVWVTRIGYA